MPHVVTAKSTQAFTQATSQQKGSIAQTQAFVSGSVERGVVAPSQGLFSGM